MTMEHLSVFVFINVANMALARRDAYFAHIKAGLKQDTLSALRQTPIHLPMLFQDQILKKAEDIVQHENKGHSSHSSSSHEKDCYHPYHRPEKSMEQKSGKPAWKTIGSYRQKIRASPPSTHHVRPRASLLINDDYCVNFQCSKRLARSKQTLNVNQCHHTGPECKLCSVPSHRTRVWKDIKDLSDFTRSCKLNCATHAHIVKGQPQKKGVSPAVVRQRQSLKYVNNVSCVNHLSSVNLVPNVKTVASDLPVGAR